MTLEPGILIGLVTGAAALGAALYRLGSLEARTRELEAFRSRAGERIGKLESSSRHLTRALTRPQGVAAVAAVPELVDEGEEKSDGNR